MSASEHATTEVSVIIPVFNEEENVLPLSEEVVAAMKKVGRSCEIVFVDDASTDSTWERIQRAQEKHPQVRGLRHLRNGGQSAATWTGIQATASPILVTLDGDGQNDPADLPGMFAALKECDFVCGARQKRQDTVLRRLSSAVARWARQRALKSDFCDTGCALRVFRREALDGIFPFNGLHRFLPVLVQANGARAREVPICHRPRTAGKSKYGLNNRLWRGIYDLMAIAWYQKRRLGRMEFIESPAPHAKAGGGTDRGTVDFRTRSPELRSVETK
jgi:dolichol-phosphate mannosyltransferase